AGVLLDGATNVTLRSGTVTGFDAGVYVMGGSGNTVTSITARDNINDNTGSTTDANVCALGDGIAVLNSDSNTISSNTVVHNGPYSGISLLEDADGNTVRSNTVEDNNVPNLRPNGIGNCGAPFSRAIQDIGIRVEGPGADNNLVSLNRVVNSAIGGITVHGYVYCPSLSGGGCGPSQSPNTGNLIQFNYVADTGRTTYAQDPLADGIAVLRQGPRTVVGVSQGNTIAQNTVVNSYRHGVYLGNPTQPGPYAGNVVSGNTIHYSLVDGGEPGLRLAFGRHQVADRRTSSLKSLQQDSAPATRRGPTRVYSWSGDRGFRSRRGLGVCRAHPAETSSGTESASTQAAARTSWLLDRAGTYLQYRAQFGEAKPPLRAGAGHRRGGVRPDHPPCSPASEPHGGAYGRDRDSVAGSGCCPVVPQEERRPGPAGGTPCGSYQAPSAGLLPTRPWVEFRKGSACGDVEAEATA
ncbi:MAG: right-handed parallel beta-helix repeat-containing protein, partial [Actinobacteria bacterium]|nr:right-handed parallel beta-helix repeat-containing protein [Actinomycetota bacterium]